MSFFTPKETPTPRVYFKLEKIKDQNTGVDVDTLVQYKVVGEETEKDVWCTVVDLDNLFNTCVSRWGSNWDLEKVLTTIRETEIE